MPTSPAVLLRVFAAAIFLSAALLFAVQPMFTKMVLPKLGGTPAVWSVAMVFFQAVLLAGYAYAHALTKYLPGKRSIVVHVVVMCAATLFLPLAIASWWGRPPADATAAFWLLGLFGVSIGLPFFALSANGPLLQAWFARTNHPSAANPYFLYAASNIGSFLALLSYPFVLEPLSTLGQQTRGWAVLFIVLIVLIAWCGWLMLRAPRAEASEVQASAEPPPAWREAARWVVLAAVPSGLLVSVTAHISTDIAAAPFMWVIPLALYLATFVIVFSNRPILPHNWMVAIEPLFIVAIAGIIVLDIRQYVLGLLVLNVVAFFVITMVCHGELSRSRPPAQHLTAFYMWMSAGGVIGGIFAGLIAPNVFSWVLEYPLLVVAAILLRPGLEMPTNWRTQLLWAAAIAVVAIAAYPGLADRYVTDEKTFYYVVGGLLVVAGLVSREPLAVRRRDRRGVHHRHRVPALQRSAPDDAQLLRRAQDHRNGRRLVPCFHARHHDPWCRASARRQRRADHRTAADDHLLSSELADGRDRESRACARQRADQGRGGRARHRHVRMLRGAGRQLQVLRDRRERREARARSHSLPVPGAMRARYPGRARRCPADSRPRARTNTT